MPMTSIAAAWRGAWQRPPFRLRFFITMPILALMLSALAVFLQWVERRPGVVVPDPVLRALPMADLTWVIFGVIYGALVAAIVALARDPDRLLLASLSYSLMVIFRIGAMGLLPLDPPAPTIPLQDPFVQLFGTGNVLMKDLFFSGHTSTLVLLFLTARRGKLRIFFLLCTAVVVAAILIHHTHYAVDVYIAPFVAYTSYRVALLLTRHFDPAAPSP
jgi:hypothetical protein